ncbi:MAG: AMP-binding protein [Desulfobacterales bacterium]|nr:AMP-binding protein [Desulfobacterales bacterium]
MTKYDDKPWLKSYDENVTPEIEIPNKTYVDLLEEGMNFKPQRPFVNFMGNMLTFCELDILSRRFAAYLAENGIGRGDVVGINLPNIPQYLIAFCGSLRAGCAVTGISPLLTPKEMAYQLNDSGAKVFVTLDAIFENRFLKISDTVPNLKHVIATGLGELMPFYKEILGKLLKKFPTGKVTPVNGKNVLEFKEFLSGYPFIKLNIVQNFLSNYWIPKLAAAPVPDDPCLIQYTGGTTGLPKGTVLTHKNMVSNITQAKQWIEFQNGKDIMCSAFPLFHLAGLILAMVAMSTGNTQCLIPDPRNTNHICQEINHYKPTIMANVPTLYQMLIDNPQFKKLNFSQLKLCMSGAAPFSIQAISALESIVGKNKVLEVYGMTESSPLLTMNPYKGRKKIGSVGIPIPNTEIKMVDVETRTCEVPIGQEGELIARGPQVMRGYHNKPEETKNALREFQGKTWLYTGDIAKMDEDGFVYIVDRAKDMLNVGGYKVFSREVEETLYQHPSIEICAIIGIPNPDRPGNDIVKAMIQLKSEDKKKDSKIVEKDILSYCKENMSPYKVPKIIEFIESIPLTPIGKVDKKALRR